MWKTYKKEIMEKEKKEADFLQKYYKYQTNTSVESSSPPDSSTMNTEDEKDNGQANIYEEDDWPVQVSFFLLLYRIWKSSSNFFSLLLHLMLSPRKTVTFLRLYQSFLFDKLKTQQQRVHMVLKEIFHKLFAFPSKFFVLFWFFQIFPDFWAQTWGWAVPDFSVTFTKNIYRKCQTKTNLTENCKQRLI